MPQETEYIPASWEDDYCQIEIVPLENRVFIVEQIKQINNLHANTQATNGFTSIHERDFTPVTTLSKEIRADYFERLLLEFEFRKADHSLYDNKLIDCDTATVKALGFRSFTIFFDIQNEFVKNIWVDINLIVSVTEFDKIEKALYYLGEELEVILVDWNQPQLYDLANKTQVHNYLMRYWK